MPRVKRRSRLSLRAERAAVTKNRIAASARMLFARRGYAATTLVEIAAEAGVAVQTVYAVFGSKAGILRALRESLVRQPQATDSYESAVKETDPARKLELFAASIRKRWEGGHDIVNIHEQAASSDPGLRKEVEVVLGTRRAGIDRLVRSMKPDRLKGLSPDKAAAIVDALTLPEVYRELVSVHGWGADQFEVWLARTMKQQLLG